MYTERSELLRVGDFIAFPPSMRNLNAQVHDQMSIQRPSAPLVTRSRG